LIGLEDAVRLDKEAFKATYERGYRKWFSLYEMTVAEPKDFRPWWDSLFQLEYPASPGDFVVNTSFSNPILARGISTWKATPGSCDLPYFDQEFFVPVASDCPTILEISDRQQPTAVLTPYFPGNATSGCSSSLGPYSQYLPHIN
jgi:hypothetical protein